MATARTGPASPGLDTLSRAACFALLAGVPVGRLVATADALPLILPVTFALDGESVVVRTSATSRLAAATNGTVVAFEADEIDVATRSGWSVVVLGLAEPVTDRASLDRVARLGLVPWAAGDRDHYVAIRATSVTGRRLRPVRSSE